MLEALLTSKLPYKLGLTGSIGSGKSSILNIFASYGFPVYDADRVVSEFYAGEAVPLIKEAFPESVQQDRLDKNVLWEIIRQDRAAWKRLESIVHPFVFMRADAFIAEEGSRKGCNLVVLDIPLLFECEKENYVDAVLLVVARQEVRRARVLLRPGMTEDKFRDISAHQFPAWRKRLLADFVIDTSDLSMEEVRQEVDRIILKIHQRIQA